MSSHLHDSVICKENDKKISTRPKDNFYNEDQTRKGRESSSNIMLTSEGNPELGFSAILEMIPFCSLLSSSLLLKLLLTKRGQEVK